MSALDDIAFLADSKHRIAALKALAANPRGRNELEESLGISRSTINRILEGFSERDWVTANRQHYEITPLGEHVVAGFTTLLRTMETEARLRKVVQ